MSRFIILSEFDRGGSGVARFSILNFVVVAAEWPEAFHFHRGARGVARFCIFIFVVVAAERPDSGFLFINSDSLI